MKITGVLVATVFVMVVLTVLRYDRSDPGAIGGKAEARSSGHFAVDSSDVPTATGARIVGRKLIVTGENFDSGAVILIDGAIQKTRNDPGFPVTVLVAKKAAKKFGRDQIVKIQVRNANGRLSEELAFHTGCGS